MKIFWDYGEFMDPILDLIESHLGSLNESVFDFILEILNDTDVRGKLSEEQRAALPAVVMSLLGRILGNSLQSAMDEIFDKNRYMKFDNIDYYNKLCATRTSNGPFPIPRVLKNFYKDLIWGGGTEIELNDGKSEKFTLEYPKLHNDFTSVDDMFEFGNEYLDRYKYIIGSKKSGLNSLCKNGDIEDCYVAVVDEENGKPCSGIHWAFKCRSKTASGKYIVYMDQTKVTDDVPIVYTPLKNVDFTDNFSCAKTILPKSVVQKTGAPIIECNF